MNLSLPFIDLTTTLILSERLLSLSVFLQTIELFQLRKTWSDRGVWRWPTLKKEFQSPWYQPFLRTSGFSVILIMRMMAAILVWITPCAYLNAFLFLSTWIIAIRWRGLFNGGSDSMTIVVSIGLWATRALIDHPTIAKYALAYIGIQLSLSYFVAGMVKLKNREWRQGLAMPTFLRTPRYDSPPESVRIAFDNPAFSKMASFTVILIECLFPLAWIDQLWGLSLLCMVFAFHLLNYWIFGLNRFVFAWLSAYPALYFWSQSHL